MSFRSCSYDPNFGHSGRGNPGPPHCSLPKLNLYSHGNKDCQRNVISFVSDSYNFCVYYCEMTKVSSELILILTMPFVCSHKISCKIWGGVVACTAAYCRHNSGVLL